MHVLMPNGRLSLVTVGREDQRQILTNAVASQLISLIFLRVTVNTVHFVPLG